ncbi:DUF7933 domain-containing protein [Arcticibacterium luteifluviistationis]|uniref:Ig-like domain-containing protein n=1 Tax=Arcticibacterium luteifluviistationis TaxID=1784714 RepID=A0A2Z4GHA7_9BACT|nr:3-coathanger stack domain-containing protein [Arcticibacterium luteifluviistationis]AWW00194.1 hypothetical protein DJ013_19265 [Arcticibacterium luteifluviistationis]
MKRTTTVLLVLLFFVKFSLFAQSPPSFNTYFSPNSVGPGSSSLLTYTINNSGGVPVTDIAFTNTLPAGLTIASPSGLIFNEVDGTVTAPDGGTTISFTGGRLGAGASLTIQLYVKASSVGTLTNTTGDLTSSAGNSGTATDDLVVSADFVGFSHSFDKPSIFIGETANFTFTFDNVLNSNNVQNYSFLTNLPEGLVLANPLNIISSCVSQYNPVPGFPSYFASANTLSANSGESSIGMNSGYIEAGTTCSISLDVEGVSLSENVISTSLSGTNANGVAVSSLSVIPNSANGVIFGKRFTDRVISTGDTTMLEFTISNVDRSDALTAISFTDDLDAVLSGMIAVDLPTGANVCGSGTLSFSGGSLSFSGGSLPAEGSCTFSVPVKIPANASAGAFTNITTAITGDRGGRAVTGPVATANFGVKSKPILTKEIVTNPAAIGGSTIFRYTLLNTDPNNELTLGQFMDDAHGFANTATFSFPSAGFCGASSSMSLIADYGTGPVSYSGIQLSDATLPAGTYCTFDVGVTFPSSVDEGVYPSEIIALEGTLDGFAVSGKVLGNEDLIISTLPKLSKNVLGNPSILPGDTVTFEYQVILGDGASQTFSGIGFGDDFSSLTSSFSATLNGLEIVEIFDINTCSPVVISGDGTDSLSFSGGSMSPGDTCSFKIKVKLAADATFGTFLTTTSNLVGDTFTRDPASTSFDVIGMVIKKEYSQPIFPGDNILMTYSFINPHPSDMAVFFNSTSSNFALHDLLNSQLNSLTYSSGAAFDSKCGSNPSITGTTSLRIFNVSVAPLDTCKLTIPVSISTSAEFNSYETQLTKPLYLTKDGSTILGGANSFQLLNGSFEVSPAIEFSKSFLSNAEPGDTVLLAFTIKNVHPSQGLSNISFTDNVSTMYSGFTTVDLPQSNVVGTGSVLTTEAGGDFVITLDGGSLAGGAEITFNVKVKVPDDIYSGTFTNTTSPISFDLNANTFTYNAASADLIVNNNRRPTFSKAFAQDTILTGQNTTLTFTVDNSLNGDAITSYSFSDNLPEGMVISSTPNIINSCAVGTVTATAGSSSFSFTGGSVAGSNSCTFSVDITAYKSKTVLNTSEELISEVGSSGKAIDSIYVKMPEPVLFSAITASSDSILLNVSPNVNNSDSVLVAFSSDGVFGNPAGFLNVGSSISGGGEVLFKGLAANVPNHLGLSQSTLYYYKVWSLGYDLYSDIGLTAQDTTCVNPSQAFDVTPSEAVVCVGTNPKLTVGPILENVNYTWQVKQSGGSFTDVVGSALYSKEDSSTLLLTNVSLLENNNVFRCIINSKCDVDTTSEFTLEVFGNPIISIQPKDSSTCAGNDVEFYVNAEGPGLTFQWQKWNGSSFDDISGATNDTLAFSSVLNAIDSTFYRCSITGTCGLTISDTALLRAPLIPVLTPESGVNPSTCLGTDGSIPFTSQNLPAGTYQISFTGGAGSQSVQVANDTFSLKNLAQGTYENFMVTYLECSGINSASVTLTDPPTPTIMAGAAVNPSTCLGADGSIPFTSTNLPAGTYTISFTGGLGSQSVAVANDTFSLKGLSSGAYSGFSVTHLACTGSDASSKTLTDPPTPTITAGTVVNPSTCLGADGSIPFTSTNLPAGTYTISFTGGLGSQSVAVANDTFSLKGLSSGAYSGFSVTHLACTGSDASSKTLTDPPTPTITAGTVVNPSTCLGADGSIPFTSTNLIAGTYTISFTGGSGSQSVAVANDTFSLKGLSSGEYSGFSVTHLACTGSDASSKTLTDPPTPTITAGTVVNPSTCLGADGSIPFTSTNLPAGTYTISFTGGLGSQSVAVANDTFSLKGLSSGTYSGFSVTHLACTGSDASSKTLTDPPTPTITAGTAVNPSTCLGADGSISFTSTNLSDGTYSLSFTSTGIASPQNVTVSGNAFTLEALSSGAYSNFSVTHLACTGSDASSKALIDPPTPTITAGTAVNPSTCLGTNGSIPFTSTNLPDGTYSLSFTSTGIASPQNVTVSGNAFTLEALSSGAYSNFSVTHLACTGSNASSKILIDPPTPTITAGTAVNPSTCLGTNGSIPFTSTNLPDGTYSLSFTSTGIASPQNVTVTGNAFTLEALSSGEYSNFSVTHLSCTGTDVSSIELEDPTFSISASNLGPYEEGDLVQLFVSNGVSFDWSGPNAFQSTLQNPSIATVNAINSGVYSVTVVDENNCVVEVTTEVDVACTTPSMSYYLAYGGGNPELITPLRDGMQIQQSSRAMTVLAFSTCTSPVIESVKLQLSGTSNLQYHIDNNMPFNLHEVGNVSNGEVLPNNRYTFISRGYSEDDAMGTVLVGEDIVQFDIIPPLSTSSQARVLTEPSFSETEICVGSSFDVSTSVTGAFMVGNLYQVYLSDKKGYFSSRTLIGSSNNPSSISCTIPNYVKGGSAYKVMVVSTAPVVSSVISSASLHIISSDLVLSSPDDDLNGGASNYKAINSIKAGNKIEGGANVSLSAKRKIELEPGFIAEQGTVFKAEMKENCPSLD